MCPRFSLLLSYIPIRQLLCTPHTNPRLAPEQCHHIVLEGTGACATTKPMAGCQKTPAPRLPLLAKTDCQRFSRINPGSDEQREGPKTTNHGRAAALGWTRGPATSLRCPDSSQNGSLEGTAVKQPHCSHYTPSHWLVRASCMEATSAPSPSILCMSISP